MNKTEETKLNNNNNINEMRKKIHLNKIRDKINGESGVFCKASEYHE